MVLAYVDPGSGSLIVQALIALIVFPVAPILAFLAFRRHRRGS